jgi:glycosyltransferase involved in cell wall biosynthesis
LPSGSVNRWRLLREVDAIYLRFEGQPIKLPRRLHVELTLLGWKKPVIWEMNATSDYCALMWGAEGQEVDIERLDQRIRLQTGQVKLAICNTGGLEQYSRFLGIPRGVVIPLGSDPAFFKPNVPLCQEILAQSADLNVVWCGSPEIRWHDLDSIVSAARILKKDKRIRFFIIGKTGEWSGCPENVTIVGEVPRKRLPSVLSCMDVGLALYRDPSWSRFGVYSSPLKLFDYMASGLVVVASPIEQVTDVIREGETGFLVPYDDTEALAGRLSKIANEEMIRREIIGRQARDLVLQYYNWKRVAEETASEIKRVL